MSIFFEGYKISCQKVLTCFGTACGFYRKQCNNYWWTITTQERSRGFVFQSPKGKIIGLRFTLQSNDLYEVIKLIVGGMEWLYKLSIEIPSFIMWIICTYLITISMIQLNVFLLSLFYYTLEAGPQRYTQQWLTTLLWVSQFLNRMMFP